MKPNRRHLVILLAALLVMVCMFAVSCGRDRVDETSDKEKVAAEQAEKTAEAADESADAEQTQDSAAAEEANSEKKAKTEKKTTEKSDKSENSKKTEKKKDTSKSSSSSSSNKSSSDSSTAQQPAEKKKVWVEPVTETRTVTLDTGTRYCNGPNSNGGCGASWHGTKDSTYDKWYAHWQDYVKKRTKEEAEKGNTYVCDHIHDDSRWVPDTTTETVVVQEGYWKEVD